MYLFVIEDELTSKIIVKEGNHELLKYMRNEVYNNEIHIIKAMDGARRYWFLTDENNVMLASIYEYFKSFRHCPHLQSLFYLPLHYHHTRAQFTGYAMRQVASNSNHSAVVQKATRLFQQWIETGKSVESSQSTLTHLDYPDTLLPYQIPCPFSQNYHSLVGPKVIIEVHEELIALVDIFHHQLLKKPQLTGKLICQSNVSLKPSSTPYFVLGLKLNKVSLSEVGLAAGVQYKYPHLQCTLPWKTRRQMMRYTCLRAVSLPCQLSVIWHANQGSITRLDWQFRVLVSDVTLSNVQINWPLPIGCKSVRCGSIPSKTLIHLSQDKWTWQLNECPPGTVHLCSIYLDSDSTNEELVALPCELTYLMENYTASCLRLLSVDILNSKEALDKGLLGKTRGRIIYRFR